MESTNNALKLISKTRELLKCFVEDNDIQRMGCIEDAIVMLAEAIEELAV